MFSLCLLWVVPAISSEHHQDILSDLAVLDQDINNIFSLLPQQVDTARLSIANTRATANRLSLSYGIAVALGTLITIDVSLVDKRFSSRCTVQLKLLQLLPCTPTTHHHPPTHINFKSLFLSPLWSDLSM